jgi:hypothetical protein
MASRTVFDRLWDILWGLDALYLALILAAGIAWGTFTVGSWIVAAGRSGAWWNFALMASTSAFLLGGVVRELTGKRPGPFALFTFVASLLIGLVDIYG